MPHGADERMDRLSTVGRLRAAADILGAAADGYRDLARHAGRRGDRAGADGLILKARVAENDAGAYRRQAAGLLGEGG